MDPLAALASPAALFLLIVTVGYVLTCAVWPYKPCPRCRGSALRRAPLGRSFRFCRSCRGTGLRLRAGRRAWTALRRIHHANHTPGNRHTDRGADRHR